MPRTPSEKAARRLKDGRVELSARVGEHLWRCACTPEDGHDHAAVLRQFVDDLDRRDAVLANLQNLVGLTGTLRGADYTVVGVGINVLGAGLFRARVEVDILAPGDADGVPDRKVFEVDFTNPKEIRFQKIVAEVLEQVGLRGDRLTAAQAEVDRFLS